MESITKDVDRKRWMDSRPTSHDASQMDKTNHVATIAKKIKPIMRPSFARCQLNESMEVQNSSIEAKEPVAGKKRPETVPTAH